MTTTTTATENGNNRERKNAQDIHPKKVSAMGVDAAPAPAPAKGKGDDAQEDEKKKKNKTTQQQQQGNKIYFGFLKEQHLALIIVLVTLVRLFIRYKFRPKTFITCTEDQPLMEVKENFLNFLEYEKIRKCTLNHPRLKIPSALSSGSFSKTRGFVVKFNKEGVDSFLNHPDYGD